jgi:hypothetical protein
VNGSSGTSGSSGASGTSTGSGVSGTSGSSGVNGGNGASGGSGTSTGSGTSGSSGTSGVNGASGGSGTSTGSGVSGTSGSSGVSGGSGVSTGSGTSGSSGVSGASGVSGVSGTSGSSGSSGVSGASGGSGTSTGSGTSGSSGVSGVNGTNGSAGTNGSSGVSGTSYSSNPYPLCSNSLCSVVPQFGGNSNDGFGSTITGGFLNSVGVATGCNFIGGGCENVTNGQLGVVLGGHCNQVSGFKNAIGGGRCNCISGGSYNVIGGGPNNCILGGNSFSYILGGYYNTLYATQSGVVNYNISTTSFYSNNTAYFYYLSKTAGSFKIEHPDPSKCATMELWHSFVESPTAGDNLYRYVVTTQNGTATLQLPDYYKFLNENSQLKIAPVNHFGKAYGVIDPTESFVTINSTIDGDYNVLLVGTRKDPDAKHAWKGAERIKPECSSFFGI